MRPVLLVLAILGLIAGIGHAHAQTCSVASTGLSFGQYSTFSATDNTAAGTITVSCTSTTTASVAYTVELGTGNSGSYSARSLTSGTSALTYQLYTNSAESVIWGDGTTDGTSDVSGSASLSGSTVSQSYTVYGKLPANQNVTVGSYSDVIQIIVTY